MSKSVTGYINSCATRLENVTGGKRKLKHRKQSAFFQAFLCRFFFHMVKYHPFAGIICIVVFKCIFTRVWLFTYQVSLLFPLLRSLPRIKQRNPVWEEFCGVTFLLSRSYFLGEKKKWLGRNTCIIQFKNQHKMPTLHYYQLLVLSAIDLMK